MHRIFYIFCNAKQTIEANSSAISQKVLLIKTTLHLPSANSCGCFIERQKTSNISFVSSKERNED